ncbi:NAD(P)/FAD-dependent oxidoreductase [Actinomadura sp. 9N407]|uniref:NAD(P)/FAD-dependent oxidoreductase n=1 Tax=Actinomadura sp. 9N407 TaxID=3375154 RepID=UPI003795BE96
MDIARAPLATDFDNGVSYWSPAGASPADRPAGERLPGPRTADVCIVGAGYTGLWTAYYLKRAQPGLRIVVLEKDVPGHGASGRDGGRLVAGIPGSCTRFARRHGRPAVAALQRAMFDTIDEIVRVAVDEGIDAGLDKNGVLYVARNPAQRARLETHVRLSRTWGWTEDDLHADIHDRVNVTNAVGAAWSPHGATVHPAAMVRGLARVVGDLGVEIYEHTPALRIRPRSSVSPAAAATPYGSVAAEYVIRATEGFTAALEGHHRDWLPMNTSTIVTGPLPPDAWEAIGWEGGELLAGMTHCHVQAQRTADGRIAIGGRGSPYRYGSRLDDSGRTTQATVDGLWRILTAMFPAVASGTVTHAWSGVLGVPRDRCSSVTLDHRTGLGHAGGYTGSGVAASNLAGRTLRDLLLERDTPLTTMPWVGWKSRPWEPEPLRWLGIQTGYTLYRAADVHERASSSSKTSPLARLADTITGH